MDDARLIMCHPSWLLSFYCYLAPVLLVRKCLAYSRASKQEWRSVDNNWHQIMILLLSFSFSPIAANVSKSQPEQFVNCGYFRVNNDFLWSNHASVNIMRKRQDIDVIGESPYQPRVGHVINLEWVHRYRAWDTHRSYRQTVTSAPLVTSGYQDWGQILRHEHSTWGQMWAE